MGKIELPEMMLMAEKFDHSLERIRRAKHRVDCERETSLEIIGPVGASGSKLWA